VFAPQAAEIVTRGVPALEHFAPDLALSDAWPDDLAEVVYVDHYGNVISGYRYDQLPRQADLSINGQPCQRARTFSDVSEGELLAYRNANGLLEIAMNRGHAAGSLGVEIGTPIQIGV
jgi:S-adenosylmethionine hydrolase